MFATSIDRPFANRRDAGRRPAAALLEFKDVDGLVIIAPPRGGVPVAAEIATALGKPFDLLMVRKLGVPGHEEVAMGAVASNGICVLNHDLIRMLGLSERQVNATLQRETSEIARREQLNCNGRPLPVVTGRSVIFVDDGIATGSTMAAAVALLRHQRERRIIAAVPHRSERHRQPLAQRSGPGDRPDGSPSFQFRQPVARRFLPDQLRGGPRLGHRSFTGPRIKKDQPRIPMKNIIAAVDFSNTTPAVMEISISLAKSFNTELQLLHVIEPEPAFVTYGFTAVECPAMNSIRDEIIRRAKAKMEKILTHARKDVPRTVAYVPEGSPLLELLKQVRQSGADFIVVGSHGHGLLSSLLLGSVAEGMVRKATVPTLIVSAAPE